MQALRRVWRRWKRVAEASGNFQLWLITSILFFVMLPAVALPFRALSDPLRLRAGRRHSWEARHKGPETLADMLKQG